MLFFGRLHRTRGDAAGEGKTPAPAEKLLIALALAALAGAALAGETINYRYDARGRLIRVEHNGSVNANVTANYAFDKADNRTFVNVVSPNSPP